MSRVYEPNKMSWGYSLSFPYSELLCGRLWLFFLICLVNRKITWVFFPTTLFSSYKSILFSFSFYVCIQKMHFLKIFPFHWNFQICWHKITYDIFLVYTIHNSVSIILSTLASWFCYFFYSLFLFSLILPELHPFYHPFLKN